MSNIKKSWKSSLVGLIILGYVIYRAFWLNLEIDFHSIFAMLVSVGFFAYKDKAQKESEAKTGGESPIDDDEDADA